jgi:DNA-binding protein HU-beta
MSDRVNKTELIRRIALRTGSDEKLVETYLDATLDEIYEAIKAGEGVTLTGFGSFYVRVGRSSWTFKFNPSQKLRKLLGWSSTYKGKL